MSVVGAWIRKEGRYFAHNIDLMLEFDDLEWLDELVIDVWVK
jgi:hypothetical protein